MDTGGLHCPDLTQRRLALFSLAALCVSRVDPAPNDPVLRGYAKGGAAGGGCALMRTLGRFPAAIVTGVDRIRCSVIQILGARKPPVWAWHHPDEER